MAFIVLPIIFAVLFGGVILINIILALIKGTIQNIIAADAIIVAAVVFFLTHNNGVHTVFSIILGLVAAGVFVGLTKIPYFGKVFVVVCGLSWAFGLYYLIDDGGIPDVPHVLSEMFRNDPIWWWTIVILMIVVFVGLHLKCVIKNTYTDNDLEGYQPEVRKVSTEELLGISTEEFLRGVKPTKIKNANTKTVEKEEHKEFEIFTPSEEEIANSVPYEPNRK